MPQTSAPDRKVPTRRISFEESLQDLPQHFAADGDLILSHLAAALSSVFPDGEDFFVRSVRHYRDQITDPELKRQVAGFIGQEAMHGREHRALNDRLAELGYPTKRFERLTKRGLDTARAVAPPDRRTWPPPPRSSTSPPRSPSSCSRATRPERCSGTRRSATCSCGTRSRSPSTRPSPSTSTRRSAAASACGCGR